MNFYVPILSSARVAENFRDDMRALMAELGDPTTDRRIRALVRDVADGEDYVMVGGDVADWRSAHDPVMLILEAADRPGMVYVFTVAIALRWEAPWTVTLGKRWTVVDFDDGKARRA